MASPKIQDIILNNTPFQNTCIVYKENSIPILKEYNIDQCKESVKHILDMTKTPLSHHVDVLIPNLDRNHHEKQKLAHVKGFFGTKYTPSEEKQQQTTLDMNSLRQKSNDNTRNACIFEMSTSNYIKELISTEESHVTYLEEIVYKCMIPIKESIEKKSPILDQYSYNRIFRNTDDLLTANKAFLTSLIQYREGATSETFGEIFLKHIESFDCYKVYYLGQPNAASCHKKNIKENKNYLKFHLNAQFIGSLDMNDMVGEIIKRLGRYALLLKSIVKEMEPSDADVERLKYCLEKLDYLNNVHYGDSSLLNLYHRIKDAPASLIQKRQLLGYYDATELSLLSGKTNRPVTILVFNDKLMVVKRKNYNLQGKDILENIDDKPIDKISNNVFQKAKDAYNGSAFEFKGWVDIRQVEIFNGLKDRQDTFFVRTSLPEQSPDATEKECEEYFRRSDRLYSILPSTSLNGSLASYYQKKNTLISLCQKQFAIAKLEDTQDELYIENKFKLPAYTHFYNEKSYRQAKFKNNMLIVYVEERFPAREINLNSLINDDVWVVVLLTNQPRGYKLTIRARTNLIPIRERSRELEYESLIEPTEKVNNGFLDFIDTLWNNVFFYERRLRATQAYSYINDGLLRGRARSRSRSKSLTRVASNMSIGKLFARSRSSSPSRPSSIESQEKDDTLHQTSHVANPIFKVATVNKQQGNEFRNQTQISDNGLHSDNKPHKVNTQPYFYKDALLHEDTAFIDYFNQSPSQQQMMHDEALFTSGNYYQDNHSYRRRSSVQSYPYDTMPLSQSPELIPRPTSGSSNNSSASSETSPGDLNAYLSRRSLNSDSVYNTTSSYTSSRSFYDDKCMDILSNRERYGSVRSTSSTSYDERLMSTIDNSRRVVNGSIRKAPLKPNFYNQTPIIPHRVHNTDYSPNYSRTQIKNDVNDIIEDIIQSQQQLKSEDMNHYCIRRLQAIVSKIDDCMDGSY